MEEEKKKLKAEQEELKKQQRKEATLRAREAEQERFAELDRLREQREKDEPKFDDVIQSHFRIKKKRSSSAKLATKLSKVPTK